MRPCLVWTVAELRGGRLAPVSFELLSRGRALADALGTGLAAVAVGRCDDPGSLRELIERGADAVYAALDDRLGEFRCLSTANVLERLARERAPSVVIAGATAAGRTLMPYLAVRLGAGLTADCTELAIEPGTGCLLQTRPAIGGNIMATIKTPERRPQMATVRPRSSKMPDRVASRAGEVELVTVLDDDIDERERPLGRSARGGDSDTGGATGVGSGVALDEAEIVVAGGRGLKKADRFALVSELAADLNAAVGASREAVDRGWIAYPHQVGLSGKTVSPRLYVGMGVSGAIQHLAGIKTSEVIVSINPDPDAPLHAVADYAVVADAFRFVPELRKAIAARRAQGGRES